MRLGQIVLRIRTENTSFGNFVGGVAELDVAIKNTLTKDMAFVLPLIDEANRNNYDVTFNQRLTERFGVIVAIANDDSQSDKLGFSAYEKLHDIRSELIRALVGWIPLDSESMIMYRGGRLIDINNGYMWYQFEFEYDSRIISEVIEITKDGKIVKEATGKAVIQSSNFDDTETPTPFDTIYMQLINTPDARIPHVNKFGEDGEIPYDDNFPDVALPDMANWIDLTQNPDAGAFTRAFHSGFEVDNT